VGYLRAKHIKLQKKLPMQLSRVAVGCIQYTATMDSCADHMQDHGLERCESVTQENKAEAQKHVEVIIKPTFGKSSPTSLSRAFMKKGKREQLEVGQSLHGKLSKQQQTAINRKSLMFIIINDTFFRRGEMGFSFSSLGRSYRDCQHLTGLSSTFKITRADDASNC